MADASCSGCHQPDGPEFGPSITGAHVYPGKSAQLAGVVFDILKIELTGPGENPLVTFSIRNNKGEPLEAAKIDNLRLVVAWPTTDYRTASEEDARKNRRPTQAIIADPCETLQSIARELDAGADKLAPWKDRLRTRDGERESEIDTQAAVDVPLVHPLKVCKAIDEHLADDSVLVADGGDFVATASYVTAPRGPFDLR